MVKTQSSQPPCPRWAVMLILDVLHRTRMECTRTARLILIPSLVGCYDFCRGLFDWNFVKFHSLALVMRKEPRPTRPTRPTRTHSRHQESVFCPRLPVLADHPFVSSCVFPYEDRSEIRMESPKSEKSL